MHESRHPLAEIVETVATFEEVPPEDLPSLADAVPSEIMTRMTTEWADQTDPIEFTYIWYHITVSPMGEITVSLPES